MSDLKRKKTFAWGTVLLYIGMFGISVLVILQPVPEEDRFSFVLQSVGVLALLAIVGPVLSRFLLRKFGRERIKNFYLDHPFLPSLIIGLVFLPIVMALMPSEEWTRSAIGLLVVFPLLGGGIVKLLRKAAEQNIHQNLAPVSDETERIGKHFFHWLFAVDELGRSLHIGGCDWKTHKIFDGDTPVPISITKKFSTAEIEQRRANVRFYWYEQGARVMADHYLVENIPRAKEGKSIFELKIKIDAKKNLTVSVAKPLTIKKTDEGDEHADPGDGL